MKNNLYFSTQLYQSALLSDPKKLKKLSSDLYIEAQQVMKMDKAGQAWSEKNYLHGFTSYSSQDKLHLLSSTVAELERHIRKHVKKYIYNLEYDISIDDLKMTQCWVNIMPPLAQHAAHIHPLSVISGTFYVDVPPKASSIKFEDPRLGLFMNTPLIKPVPRLENHRFISLKPKTGDIVLFESWLKHEVPVNQSQSPRISISFNYGWK